MGRVVTLSGPALNQMLYGDNSSFMTNYLTQQIQNLSTNMTDIGRRFLNNLQTSYNFITDSLTQFGIKNELMSAGVTVLDNYYIETTTWNALQNPNDTMMRWIMAHPGVRQLYLDQNIDGYSGHYVNYWGNHVGKDDYNYRLVTDGMVLDGEGDDCVVNHYYEDLEIGDRHLDRFEKTIIAESHSFIDWMLENCDLDFTNKSEQPTKINRS